MVVVVLLVVLVVPKLNPDKTGYEQNKNHQRLFSIRFYYDTDIALKTIGCSMIVDVDSR